MKSEVSSFGELHSYFSLLFYHGAYSSPNAFSFNEFTRAADLTTFFPFRLFPIVRGLLYTGFCMA